MIRIWLLAVLVIGVGCATTQTQAPPEPVAKVAAPPLQIVSLTKIGLQMNAPAGWRVTHSNVETRGHEIVVARLLQEKTGATIMITSYAVSDPKVTAGEYCKMVETLGMKNAKVETQSKGRASCTFTDENGCDGAAAGTEQCTFQVKDLFALIDEGKPEGMLIKVQGAAPTTGYAAMTADLDSMIDSLRKQ